MITSLTEITLCLKCGTSEYIKGYPYQSICPKCNLQMVTIPLKDPPINIDELPCPFCQADVDEIELLLGSSDINIYKCKKCGKLDGYRLLDYDYYDKFADNEFYYDDGLYDGASAKFAEDEGTFIFSASRAKKLAKALNKKEVNPQKQPIEQINELIKQKKPQFDALGIIGQSIFKAYSKAVSYINTQKNLTEKQTLVLFSTAMLMEAELNSGKKVTERNIEQIFNVDRKTIRKWKKELQK